MLSFKKAKVLAETWIDLTTNGTCEISLIEDKPYGWVFYYNSKDYDPNDISTHMVGNAPIIVDRIDCEIRVTGTAHPTEKYFYFTTYDDDMTAERRYTAIEMFNCRHT